MSLFKRPFTIKINGISLKDVLSFNYDSQSSKLHLDLLVSDEFELLNQIVTDKRFITKASFIGCSNDIAPAFIARIKNTEFKVIPKERSFMVLQLLLDVSSVKFDMVLS